mmetsp:Transcript_13148/g.23874  ORF Transcript_13148/g.23874 Transcript_13148/m.23874 type:complete len:82 (-) Transcript_13148:173-418(-)
MNLGICIYIRHPLEIDDYNFTIRHVPGEMRKCLRCVSFLFGDVAIVRIMLSIRAANISFDTTHRAALSLLQLHNKGLEKAY